MNTEKNRDSVISGLYIAIGVLVIAIIFVFFVNSTKNKERESAKANMWKNEVLVNSLDDK